MDVIAVAMPALVSSAARNKDAFVFLTFSLPKLVVLRAGVEKAGDRDQPVVRLHADMLLALSRSPVVLPRRNTDL